MTFDPASFDKLALNAIYGDYPHCFLNPSQHAVDFHHIYGRAPTKTSTRQLMSSVYNACPLSRELHDFCPFLSNEDFRWVLLNHAMKHVNQAIGQEKYKLTDIDRAFLDWALSRRKS